jgi:hypothetical protein
MTGVRQVPRSYQYVAGPATTQPASVGLTQKPNATSITCPQLLTGRRVRRGRRLGHYPYRAKPNGTYDNSSTGSPH